MSCPGSVPEAIIAFLESGDFESAILGAISIGGDSDTIAAMTGALAEAAYGVPYIIRREAFSRLPLILQGIFEEFEIKYQGHALNICRYSGANLFKNEKRPFCS